MKKTLSIIAALILAAGLSLSQEVITIQHHSATAGATPTFVKATSCTSGANTCAFTHTAGNSLLVFVGSNATGGTVTAADGGTNTYTSDGGACDNSSNLRNLVSHSFSASGTSNTVTITGATTPTIFVVEVSNITALETVSPGSNPSCDVTKNPGTAPSPAAFTTTHANTILLDFISNTDGATITVVQNDGTWTNRGTPCTTGATCFISAVGTKTVSSTGSYSDGWTVGASSTSVAMMVAYR